jgi:hypothetical protein
MSFKPDMNWRRPVPGHTRAAIVTVLVTFGVFEYATWSGLFRTSRGLLVVDCALVAIWALGSTWIWWELRRAAANKER